MRADLMGERPARFSAAPLYEQVKDTIAQQIADGQWKPNLAMPNENELARVLGVSPGTMRKALDLLESEGLVVRRQVGAPLSQTQHRPWLPIATPCTAPPMVSALWATCSC